MEPTITPEGYKLLQNPEECRKLIYKYYELLDKKEKEKKNEKLKLFES